MATLIRAEGYEHGVATLVSSGSGLCNGVTGTIGVTSTSPIHGTYSLRANPSSATGYLTYNTSGSPTKVCYSFYVRFDTFPGVDCSILKLSVYSYAAAYLQIIASDHKLAFNCNGSLGTKSVALTQGQAYRIDIRIDASAANTAVDWKVDGSLIENRTYTNTASYIGYAYLGPQTSSTCDIYFDDLLISYTTGDFPLSGDKDFEVKGLVPASAGTSSPGSNIKDNGGTVVNDSTNPAYVELDELPASSTSDYIQQDGGTSSIYGAVKFASFSESFDTVLGVDAYLAYHSAGTSANSASTKVVGDTADAVYTGDMSESSLFYKHLVLTPPTGGHVWDSTHIGALEGQVGFATDYNPVPYWDQLMLQVAYTKSTSVDLAPAEGSQGNTGDGAALTQVHVLAPAEGSQANAGDNAALTQVHALTPSEGAQGQTGDNSPITQVHALTPSEGSHGQTGDGATLTQVHVMAPAEGGQGNLGDTPNLTQVHGLTAQEGSQGQTGDNATIQLGQATLEPQEGSQGQTGDNAAITQVHALTPSEGSHAQAGDTPTLTQVHVLAPQEGAQAQVGDTPSLTQVHALVPAEGSQAQAGDTPSLTQLHVLTAQEGAQAQAGDEATITSGSVLTIIPDDVLDAMLDTIANYADRLFICSTQPTTYNEAANTYDLATHTLSPADFSKANGDASGRKLILAAQQLVPVDHTGQASHFALGNSAGVLILAAPMTLQNITAGWWVDFPQLDIVEIGDFAA